MYDLGGLLQARLAKFSRWQRTFSNFIKRFLGTVLLMAVAYSVEADPAPAPQGGFQFVKLLMKNLELLL
jgi:hypothetical protein